MVATRSHVSHWLSSLVATLVLGGTMVATKAVFNAPQPAEMLFNFTSQFLGVPWVFNLIHSLPAGLDAYAKYALFGVSTLLLLGVWFGLGLLYPKLSERLTKWGADAFYALTMVAIVGLIFMPLQGLGLFGLSESNFFYPPLASHLWAALFGLVFGFTLHAMTLSPRGYNAGRRESLRSLVGGAVAIGLATSVGQFLVRGVAYAQEAAAALIAKIQGIPPEVTPVPEHYVVSKNVFNPSVPERGWQLKITGMVDNELSFSLDDLKALPSVERTSTLTCISNQVGGDLIGNSVWTGVYLNDLLVTAGIQDGADELILRAADNYSDSFPLEAARREGTIVAYLQNGEPLTRDHGFPARVLVPGIYGMKNVKWVTEIELTNQDYKGYWQTRGWSDPAIVQTMSRIDTATATKLDDGTYGIGGIAFAGLRGIEQVEVSVDNGQSWQTAQVKPALNDLSWNLWGFTWDAEPGTYPVVVRATDGTGDTQTAEPNRPLPDGATGYHMVNVKVT